MASTQPENTVANSNDVKAAPGPADMAVEESNPVVEGAQKSMTAEELAASLVSWGTQAAEAARGYLEPTVNAVLAQPRVAAAVEAVKPTVDSIVERATPTVTAAIDYTKPGAMKGLEMVINAKDTTEATIKGAQDTIQARRDATVAKAQEVRDATKATVDAAVTDISARVSEKIEEAKEIIAPQVAKVLENETVKSAVEYIGPQVEAVKSMVVGPTDVKEDQEDAKMLSYSADEE